MRILLAAAACSACQPTVLVTDGLAPCGLERLVERGAKVVELDGSLQDALAGADAVIVRSATTLTATLIAQAPSLRCIGRAGVGLDNIDLEAASSRKIPVVTSAGASTCGSVGAYGPPAPVRARFHSRRSPSDAASRPSVCRFDSA